MQVRESTGPMTIPSQGEEEELTRASLSSVVSDSAWKDVRNFGVKGIKEVKLTSLRHEQPISKKTQGQTFRRNLPVRRA